MPIRLTRLRYRTVAHQQQHPLTPETSEDIAASPSLVTREMREWRLSLPGACRWKGRDNPPKHRTSNNSSNSYNVYQRM